MSQSDRKIGLALAALIGTIVIGTGAYTYESNQHFKRISKEYAIPAGNSLVVFARRMDEAGARGDLDGVHANYQHAIAAMIYQDMSWQCARDISCEKPDEIFKP